MNKNFYRKLAAKAASIADAKKAVDIEIYDIEEKNSMFYFAVIATADSLPHIRAIEEEILIEFKKEGAYVSHKDGANSAKWKVLDYAGLIIHIFEPETRVLYALDKVYSEAKKIKWKDEAPVPAAKPEKPAGKIVKKKTAKPKKKPALKKIKKIKATVKKKSKKKILKNGNKKTRR